MTVSEFVDISIRYFLDLLLLKIKNSISFVDDTFFIQVFNNTNYLKHLLYFHNTRKAFMLRDLQKHFTLLI